LHRGHRQRKTFFRTEIHQSDAEVNPRSGLNVSTKIRGTCGAASGHLRCGQRPSAWGIEVRGSQTRKSGPGVFGHPPIV
jgi:hypothetical protein